MTWLQCPKCGFAAPIGGKRECAKWAVAAGGVFGVYETIISEGHMETELQFDEQKARDLVDHDCIEHGCETKHRTIPGSTNVRVWKCPNCLKEIVLSDGDVSDREGTFQWDDPDIVKEDDEISEDEKNHRGWSRSDIRVYSRPDPEAEPFTIRLQNNRDEDYTPRELRERLGLPRGTRIMVRGTNEELPEDVSIRNLLWDETAAALELDKPSNFLERLGNWLDGAPHGRWVWKKRRKRLKEEDDREGEDGESGEDSDERSEVEDEESEGEEDSEDDERNAEDVGDDSDD